MKYYIWQLWSLVVKLLWKTVNEPKEGTIGYWWFDNIVAEIDSWLHIYYIRWMLWKIDDDKKGRRIEKEKSS